MRYGYYPNRNKVAMLYIKFIALTTVIIGFTLWLYHHKVTQLTLAHTPIKPRVYIMSSLPFLALVFTLVATQGYLPALYVSEQLTHLQQVALANTQAHNTLTAKARKAYQEMLEIYPTHEGAMLMLGFDAMKNHHYEQAVNYFSSLLASHHKASDAKSALVRVIDVAKAQMRKKNKKSSQKNRKKFDG